MAGTLYLVPGPIGNLGDITQRSVATLSASDIVACEDTRRSGRLLAHLGIKGKRLLPFHEHNELTALPRISRELKSGRDVAFLSDAGSPGIADPGFRLVRMAQEEGFKVFALPGPTALIPALVQSGLPLHSFTFLGFPSRKRMARRRVLQREKDSPHTLIFYESPHRIVSLLEDSLQVLGDRPAALQREISKLHEESLRGALSILLEKLRQRNLKGECVVLIGGAGSEIE